MSDIQKSPYKTFNILLNVTIDPEGTNLNGIDMRDHLHEFEAVVHDIFPDLYSNELTIESQVVEGEMKDGIKMRRDLIIELSSLAYSAISALKKVNAKHDLNIPYLNAYELKLNDLKQKMRDGKIY